MTSPSVKPGIHRRRKSPLWARLCMVFGTVLVLVSAVGLGGTVVFTQATGSFGSQNFLSEDQSPPPPRQVQGAINVLLAGIDYRKDDTSGAPIRSDTVMWLHIPATHDRAYLLSLPRDLDVAMPPAPQYGYQGTSGDKLNAAFAYGSGGSKKDLGGGMRLLRSTVEKLTGVKFDAAALVDWYGFTGITRQLGGVTMCLDEPIKSHHSNLTFPKGCSYYNADSALELVRQRYDVAGGDYGRQKLQQQFIKQILKQATGKDVLTNPAKLAGIVKAVGSSVSLDLGGYDFAELVVTLKDIRPADIVTLEVPHGTLKKMVGGQSTDFEQLVQPLGGELFTALRSEQIDAFIVKHADLATKLPQ